ncbi:hypothetical protein QKU48_gp0108 [Fadolivirus algeromassiliense]|jgi:hypothetical protein|uniref:Uncharacterized protein n=1 Tax=Fadolivirus FV1/VV64 TaxID=3070911 RepID=A0A7D3QV18_9VIRU|nr:hypothetical protein QKU48_gp0108 [Fadolivirus algeromassiliense]QKF93566.1 hypothetical protein Fadolivirus_1_108 [Fadolivirus FV1/VV64]
MNDFDWIVYRELNKDLIHAGLNTEKCIIDHWIRHGQYEKRPTKVTDIAPDFNWQLYKLCNPDLEVAGIKNKSDYEVHWIRHGQYEKRPTKVTDITPDFNWQNYKLCNPDLEVAGIKNKLDYEIHWIKHGQYEKRKYNSKKKILFICKIDYSNFVSNITACLNQYSNNYNILVVCQSKHPFDYKIQHMINYDNSEYMGTQINKATLNKIIKTFLIECNLIILSDSLLKSGTLSLNSTSNDTILNEYFPLAKLLGINDHIIQNKTILCNYIVGIHIPDLYNTYNNILNKTVDGIIVVNTYTNMLSTHKSKYIMPYPSTFYNDRFAQIDELINNKFIDNKIRIGCFQTNRQLKGFEYIDKAIDLLKQKYNIEFHSNNLNNSEIVNMRDKMVIIIDTYNISYHGFGMTLYESLGSGCIVISTALGFDKSYLYKNDIENIPFVEIMTDTDDHVKNIYVALETVLKKNIDELIKMCKASYLWYHKYMHPKFYCQLYEKCILNKILK